MSLPAAPAPRRPTRAAWVRTFAAALVLVGAVVASAPPASAHASLVAVDPPDGARLDASPDTVQLTFSERVSASLGGVRVLDSEGNRVERGATRVEGAVVEVDLAPDLRDGTYVISYRIVSADGHPVRGGSVFGVGDVEVDAGALGRVGRGGDDRRWEIVGAIGRGFAYAGTLLAAGGVLFLAVAHRGGGERRRLVRIVRIAALVGGLAGLVALPVQAALGTGQGAGSLFDDGVLGEVAADGVGLALVLALGGLAVAALAVDRIPPVAAAGAAVAAASFAATGHTRAGSTAMLATVADVTHLLVAAVWGGGVVLLWLTLRARRRDEDAAEETGAIVGRFSTLATIAILAVGVSGGVLAWSELRSLDAVTGTGYGRLFLVKLGAVVAVAALGTYNHVRLIPALARGKARAALAQLRQTLRLEAIGLLGIVAVTSVLVVVTPGRVTAEGGPVERIVELGADIGSVQLVVAPGRTGANQIHLYMFDPDGRPADLADSVELDLSLPAADLGPITRTATRAGPAHLQLNSNDLAVSGTWSVTIRLRIDRFSEPSATVEVPIAG